MIIKFPPETKQLKQTNISDILGNIWSSYNLDLTRNLGRIRVSPRGMIVATSTDLANLGTPISFAFYNGDSNHRVWAIAGTKMFYNSGRPNTSWTQDATSGTPTVGTGSDMELFNGALYVVGTSEIKKYDGAWTEIGSDIGTSNTTCCVFGGRFYYAKNSSAISSISTSDANSNASGTPNTVDYTLQLSQFGIGGSSANKIVSIRSSSNRIWIATRDESSQNDTAKGRGAKIFEWDGVSTQANKVYYIDAIATMSLIIKDDIPYVVDSDGRLLKFSGTGFKEVARLPVPSYKYLKNPLNSVFQTFTVPRGITIKDGRIQILVANEVDDSTASILENLPSGIWEYDESIGLYHKQSISLWIFGTTTTRTDYAQNRIAEVGALYNAKSTSSSSALDGDLLYGASYYTDNSTQKYGVFCNNTKDTKQKMGYFVTPKIDSPNVNDTWQKIYATHKLLLDATDRICIKYRTSEIPPVEGAISWSSTTVFTSTLDLSAFAVGDEVEITQCSGGGQIEHITAISSNAGTYTVTLANAVTGASGTAKARFQKWISLGEQTSQSIDYKELPIAKNSSWIQFKVVMYFTGEDEFNYLQLVSQAHIPTA